MTSITDEQISKPLVSEPYTPGPWALHEIVGDFTHGIRANGEIVSGYVAFVNTRWAHPNQCAEQLANAKLIAAAPELLAALHDFEREISSRFGRDEDMSPQLRAVVRVARAAVAKAEGRS